MPPGAKPPVFLDRAAYRQRRLRDASRLLPVLGAVLWLVPLLWLRADPAAGTGDLAADGGMRNSAALLYIFGVWAGMILAAAVLAARIRPDGPADGMPETDGAATGRAATDRGSV